MIAELMNKELLLVIISVSIVCVLTMSVCIS